MLTFCQRTMALTIVNDVLYADTTRQRVCGLSGRHELGLVTKLVRPDKARNHFLYTLGTHSPIGPAFDAHYSNSLLPVVVGMARERTLSAAS